MFSNVTPSSEYIKSGTICSGFFSQLGSAQNIFRYVLFKSSLSFPNGQFSKYFMKVHTFPNFSSHIVTF